MVTDSVPMFCAPRTASQDSPPSVDRCTWYETCGMGSTSSIRTRPRLSSRNVAVMDAMLDPSRSRTRATSQCFIVARDLSVDHPCNCLIADLNDNLDGPIFAPACSGFLERRSKSVDSI